jgi:hypothetical protein
MDVGVTNTRRLNAHKDIAIADGRDAEFLFLERSLNGAETDRFHRGTFCRLSVP